MALTALEQLKIVNGEEGASPDTTDLRTLVKATAFIKAAEFQQTYKDVDSETQPLAASYLNKLFALNRQIIRGNSDESLFRVIVTIIGAVPGVTLAIVQAATDTQWEVFVADNIMRAMEIVADVRKDEKTEYDGI